MSDLLRMTGMYSGMDTESIVSQLVKTKSTKVTKLKNEQKKLEWKQNAWQDLNSKIYNMYSKTLSKLRLTSTYSQKTTTSSDTTKATVVAGSSAVNGTQTLEVKALAKSGYLTGAKLAQKKTEEKDTDGTVKSTELSDWTTSDKLSEIDSSLVGKKISISVGDATAKEIEITSDMTINGFVGKLKEAGVNASFDTTNQRFFISSTGTGSDMEFKLTDDDGALASLGLDTSVDYSQGTVASVDATSAATRIAAQDAEIVLNGATFTSSSNTFSVNGLTINAVGITDGEISIVTATDYDGIYNTIKDFFSEYNDLINEIDKLYNADSARKYDMLTDDEKDSMTDDEVERWEDKIKSALLRKDGNLYSIMNAMTSTMLDGYYKNNLSESQKKNMTQSEIDQWYKENGGKKLYLSDFGIKTKSYFECEDNEHHAYHIDGDEDDEYSGTKTDKLKAAIAEDPEGVAEYFASLCKTLYSKLDETMGKSTYYSSMYKAYNDKQLKKDYENYTKKISEAEDELSDYEDKWYNKFASMETALSKLQSQQSSISSLLGSN